MKKLLSVIALAVVLTVAFSFIASASSTASYSRTDPTVEGNLLIDVDGDINNADASEGDAIYPNNKANGVTYCLKQSAYARYDFTASAPGTYTAVISFIARYHANDQRSLDWVVSTNPNAVDLPNRIALEENAEGDDNNLNYLKFTFDISAENVGDNCFYLYGPVCADGIQSCDIYSLKLYAPVTPVTEAPATEALATNPPAPATSDVAPLMISIAAVAALSLGIIATRKKK